MIKPSYLVQFLLRPASGGQLRFRGSGFVLAPGWVLTCWHVLVPDSGPGATALRLVHRGETYTVDLGQAIRIISSHGESLDLALLPLPPGLSDVEPAPIATDLGLDFWNVKGPLDLWAW